MRLAAIGLLLGGLAAVQEEDVNSNSYKGKPAPELNVEAKNWINAKKPPKLADLKGRVVWLEFSFLG